MKKLLELLKKEYPGVNFEEEETLVTDGTLDSVEIVSLIGEIEDTFDITISMEYIKPENFNSAKAMWEMIEELQ